MSPQRRLFIGLMSGTSLDGVDAALVDFSSAAPQTLATHFAPFDPALRAALLALQAVSANELNHSAIAANGVARAYANAVQALLASAQIGARDVEAIGAHGQTVRHRPELGFTLQLNNAALLTELTGISVCADFRGRDVAAGGQGAPLAPAFHHAVFGGVDHDRIIVNIGGIANITHLPATPTAAVTKSASVAGAPAGTTAHGAVTGFDTGPGNALMDLWIQRHQGHAYDTDGAWAASGVIIPELLERMLAEPYFALPPPKSTGRDLFHAAWLDGHVDSLELHAPADAVKIQATLCTLTARTITDGIAGFASGAVREAFVCGGGAHNGRLLHLLNEYAPAIDWQETGALGVPADWVEAVAFAWLAFRLIERQPGSIATVTGARGPRILGAVYPA